MAQNNDSPQIKDNQILLTFPDKETADYVLLIARRKGFNIPDYILDNFEWDDRLDCIDNPPKKITVKTCEGCDFTDRCPDAKVIS